MSLEPVTDDYYMILEVVQTATLDQITKSYKQQALKLHPDKNPRHDATEAFQLLGKAYETLRDEAKRQAYDLIYPYIPKVCSPPQARQNPPAKQTSPTQNSEASSPQAEQKPHTRKSETLSETAQIAILQKFKREREAEWQALKDSYDSSILELQTEIQWLQQEIKNLDNIEAFEARKKARENSWGTWLVSPKGKKAEDVDKEEEKEHKDIERQKRGIERDWKKMRLELARALLKELERLIKNAEKEHDAEDLEDDLKMGNLYKIWSREAEEKQEREKMEKGKNSGEMQGKERVELESTSKIWKQEQEKQKKEEGESLRKQEKENKN
ncbi:f2a25e22-9540-47f0-baf4-3dd9ce6c34a6 [Sclerotinia trifoliorum]|uniref:F2a25e22-9540-47f0-baf4-3dd9ce6c34a6 n=1 Tax=Sclerotinia trifoliorum TaxID=28548 RepID=A0A8H2VP67_9HELO|nr:f2a25e22-9540-47f0-baf4-3dd9ce6c34a6 [Sclerotinia trifoliorum]